MSQKLKQLKEKLRRAIRKELVEYDNLNTRKDKEIEERLNLFVEKNTPTNPSKWSYYKSQAKKKFDVYPSAYANAWAAKMYKGAGGGWRKSENIDEASMTGNLDGGEGPPKTPYAFQSKKKRGQDKKKEDEISTNSTGFTKVNEGVLKEITNKELKELGKIYKKSHEVRMGYLKLTKMGDKELKDKKYNKDYKAILNAETHLMNLLRTLAYKKSYGSVNEARLDPKQTIQQLGGNRFLYMVGAKNLAIDKPRNELHMKIMRNAKGVSHVVIKLTSLDLYDMKFLSIRAGKIRVKAKEKGVYGDQLATFFKKHTGLNTRL